MNKIFLTRVSILGLFLGTTALLFTTEKSVLILFSLIIFCLSLISDKRNKLTGRLFPMIIVTIFILLFQLIFNNSLRLPDRLIQGIVAATKIFSLSMLVFFFTATISIKQITDALSFLPKKIQLAIIITFSMIPSIFEEAQKILMVQSSRGHNSKSLNIVKSLIPFIIPLLHRTLGRAEQISISIQSRGYDDK